MEIQRLIKFLGDDGAGFQNIVDSSASTGGLSHDINSQIISHYVKRLTLDWKLKSCNTKRVPMPIDMKEKLVHFYEPYEAELINILSNS